MSLPVTSQQITAQSQPARRIRMSGYLSTAITSGANIAAAVGVTAVLARCWSEEFFLNYTTTNRYMTFLFCVGSGSIGYALVKQSAHEHADTRDRALFNGLILMTALTALVSAMVLLLVPTVATTLNIPDLSRKWVLPCLGWVFGQSFLHVMLAHLRSTDQLKLANVVHWFAKTLCLVGGCCVVASVPLVEVPVYYGTVAVLVITTCTIALLKQRAPVNRTFDLKLIGRMLSYSSSRIVDSLFRAFFFVALLFVLFYWGHKKICGQTAAINTLLRGIEAICQPLVMLVMTDSIAQRSKKQLARLIELKWAALVVMSVPLMFILVLLRLQIIQLYLGEKYMALGGEFGIISLSLLPTVAMVLMRGHVEGHFKVSPIAFTSLLGVAGILGYVYWLQQTNQVTLMNVSAGIVVTRWLQFAVVMTIICQTFGVSLGRRSSFRRLFEQVRKRITR